MLATLAEASLRDPQVVYEPKYDGIRTLIAVEPGEAAGGVTILSRLGADKTSQFPEIVAALHRFRQTLKAPVILDGEIVALDAAGDPAGFQHLQGRIHLSDPAAIARRAREQPAAFVAFDVLRDGGEDLRPLPLGIRRARLERVLGSAGSPALRFSEFVPGDGTALYQRALERGWEGLVAKRLDSRYLAGRRTAQWRKLKIVKRQECVIGGWTEPRKSRAFFGALLLGVYEGEALVYVGHTGTGFSEAALARIAALLRPLERASCPFQTRPRTNERPHWVEPRLVAEVRFTEWTGDGILRHPAYIGLRDDVDPRTVRRDPMPVRRGLTPRWVGSPVTGSPPRPSLRWPLQQDAREPLDVIAQLEDIEGRGGKGTLRFPGGGRLDVSNLDKVLWPRGITKGELMCYYAWVSPFLLPVVADRPLVMRRFPDGITGKGFYQQRAPRDVPRGVRVEGLAADRVVPSRLIGGSLITLLYMTQRAAISQDPWFSRVQSLDFPDYAAFDLDPMPGVSFGQVLDVARWIRDELEALGIPSVPKTSGARGLHVYVPMQSRTSYEAGRLFCQLVSTIVADSHPRTATVARAARARGRKVYVDCLQNSRGKTLTSAYSARATEAASVSTPLTWQEVEGGVDPREFTIRTLPDRLRSVGDLWAALRASPGADLAGVLR